MGFDQRTYIPAEAKRAKAGDIIVSRPGNKINRIFTPRGWTPLHLNKINQSRCNIRDTNIAAYE